MFTYTFATVLIALANCIVKIRNKHFINYHDNLTRRKNEQLPQCNQLNIARKSADHYCLIKY